MHCCIIILNYNSFMDTKRLSLSLIDLNIQIIIVDNDSTDGSYYKLNTFFRKYEHVIIIKSNENKGYSNGNNIGMKFAIKNFHPKYLMLANPDVDIQKKFVYNLKGIFRS